jgi:hypothetical protein
MDKLGGITLSKATKYSNMNCVSFKDAAPVIYNINAIRFCISPEEKKTDQSRGLGVRDTLLYNVGQMQRSRLIPQILLLAL